MPSDCINLLNTYLLEAYYALGAMTDIEKVEQIQKTVAQLYYFNHLYEKSLFYYIIF